MIQKRLQTVLQQIRDLEVKYQRPSHSVSLLAVSKQHPVEAIREALQAGQRCFGENYAQEAVEKIDALKEVSIEWHFIGPIQSNKTKLIAEHFAWVHSIDREKIARRLNEQRSSKLPPLHACVEVNISQETSKSGVMPEAVLSLAKNIALFPNLKLRGLMAIPEPSHDFESQRRPFRALASLLQDLKREGLAVDTLSMGMSDDCEAAIAEGATIVRIGTAIFGPRNPRGLINP
ncbi:MAG: YggS family pyridoxal phosphate-dependent enzyme [Gammaproteobacteria bacterium]|nr:YggS family pyridoxal phosphate-dependent enzyme [Gammaproteobacteria bacterium]MBU1926332.1 YggS family pyridoxal phosphate-dependent enzyme [Gammaproteobacteria bacterium]MBU2545672.1 YggS family pyridoxal phosphate-dependent enzyme [Gammaproteobacteria bacterium]